MAGFANDAKKMLELLGGKENIKALTPVLPEEAQVIILNRDIWFRMKKIQKTRCLICIRRFPGKYLRASGAQ